jgi:hypothetical protein
MGTDDLKGQIVLSLVGADSISDRLLPVDCGYC